MINCWGLMEDKAKGVETSPNRKKRCRFTKCSKPTSSGTESTNNATNDSSSTSVVTNSDSTSGFSRDDSSNTTSVVRGWTKAGMVSYNKIVDHLKDIRNDREQLQLEQDLQKEYLEEQSDAMPSRSNEDNDEDDGEPIIARDAYNYDFQAA